MEEKERYEVISNKENFIEIQDTESNADIFITEDAIEDLLNQQDKRIKELEEKIEIQKNKEELIAENEAMKDTLAVVLAQKRNVGQANKKLRNENQQLKQQLHDLPKNIVEEVKDDLLDFSNGWWRYFMTDGCEYMLSSDLQGCLDEIIDTILKKYGGEDESK